MRVTVLELPAVWGEPERGLARIDALLEAGPKTDLVIVPELGLTGYVSPFGDFDASRFADSIDGALFRAGAALARKHGTHLVVPLVLAEGGSCFNAVVGIRPDGTRSFVYRKRHPWLPETWAAPGAAPHPVVAIGDLRVTVAICYDVHFLRREAKEALETADLLLFPSAWVERPDTRPARLARLARAHGIAVANANWAPGVVRVPGQGSSRIVGADGETLAVASDRVTDRDDVAARGTRLDAVVAPRR